MEKAIKWVKEDPKEKNLFWPSEEMKKKAWMSDPSIYEQAAADPEKFWAGLAEKGIDWYEHWDKIYEAKHPHFKWFLQAKLNASYNCLDRHLPDKKDKAAIIWEPEPTNEENRVLTYQDLYDEVNKFANVLKKLGVKRGDRVGIYLPMIPEVQIALLACARIGAIHSVVFSAFSPDSLKKRMEDAEAKVLVTVDGYYRRGKVINLKANADKGVEGTPVEKVVVVKRAGNEITMKEERDCWWGELMDGAEPQCEPESMDSEDTLFLLYTSGTTGKPKGIVHETGGYLTQAYWTAKWNFDLHDDDVFWCTADIGWVTGHTYACYGPLSCGATMVIYEGGPNYPEKDRWWEIAEKFGVTVFYTAPTAIRMLAKWGEEWPEKHNLNALRLLATVGEPIDQDAWLWYFEHIGGKRCPIIDTWWQTETGGTLINALPGIGPFIPTVAGRSFPGTRHELLDEEGKPVPQGKAGYLVQSPPFAPGMLRNVYKNPQRYKSEYFSEYGDEFYYTSDGAKLVDDETFRITGRVDDVMKVAGHRLSTAEVENAIATHPAVSECAVIPAPHEIKGQTPIAFVILKQEEAPSEDLTKDLIKQVTQVIGPTARPEKIIFVRDLPKTRSGKIMRRILKSLVRNEPAGNLTTLQNPECIENLKEKTGYQGEN